MQLPKAVSPSEWQAASAAFLVKEEQATLDLFDGRRQLITYRFFLAPDVERVNARMAWSVPWFSTMDEFSKDFGVDEYFGLNVFLRHGDRVFRTYFLDGPGTGGVGSIWSLLDLTPFGRQETSEDSPSGWPQTEPGWFRRHDEYSAVSR